MKRTLTKNVLLVSWAFLIFLGSSLPPTKASNDSLVDFLAHKSFHLFEYAVLYLVYYNRVAEDFWQGRVGKIFQAFLFVLIFALFDEYHQSFVPGRTAKMRDVFIDLLGAVLGFLIWKFLRRRILKKLNV